MDRKVWTESYAFSGPIGSHHPAHHRTGLTGPMAIEAPTDPRYKAYERLRNNETPDEAQFRGISDLMSTRPGVDRPNHR